MSGIRAIRRNQVRKMAEKEEMSLKQAWRLLAGREDLWMPVPEMKNKKAAARRKKRQKLQKEARRQNR